MEMALWGSGASITGAGNGNDSNTGAAVVWSSAPAGEQEIGAHQIWVFLYGVSVIFLK